MPFPLLIKRHFQSVISVMLPTYDYLYLSPHLDDCALSCGGMIRRQTRIGQRVLVVTAMAGDPPSDVISDYTASLHERWEVRHDAAAVRRAEDRDACAILGADYLHLDVPDCIYRSDPVTGQPYYVSDKDIFGEIAASDLGLVNDLGVRLGKTPHAARVIVPLGIGNHVDHQIVRRAAETIYGSELWYFEDYPYVAAFADLADLAAKLHTEGMVAHSIYLDEDALMRKVRAVAAYRSQVSTFFTDYADLERQLRAFAHRSSGERLWRYAPCRHESGFFQNSLQ